MRFGAVEITIAQKITMLVTGSYGTKNKTTKTGRMSWPEGREEKEN